MSFLPILFETMYTNLYVQNLSFLLFSVPLVFQDNILSGESYLNFSGQDGASVSCRYVVNSLPFSVIYIHVYAFICYFATLISISYTAIRRGRKIFCIRSLYLCTYLCMFLFCRLDELVVLNEIDKGCFGTVFRVLHPSSETIMAVKVWIYIYAYVIVVV